MTYFRMKTSVSGAALLLWALGLTPLSHAAPEDALQNQTAAQSQSQSAASQTFTPDYFESFAPRTASDMVSRIPGFDIRGGNNRGRGLGQGGANVLINGARISGKSTSARDALSRIPADNVIRIEIVDGASLNIAGLTGDVANIIAKADSGLSGTWNWRAQFRQGREPNWGEGEVTLTGKIGDLDYTLSVESDVNYNGTEGPEQFFDGQGKLIETAEERREGRRQNPDWTVALTYTPRADVIANFNATLGKANFNSDEVSRRQAVTEAGRTGLVLFENYEDEFESEVSADLALPLPLGVLDGTLKLIAVNRYEDSDTGSRNREFIENEPLEESRFFRRQLEGETIARTEYSWVPQAGRDWQISAEGAFNYLDIADRLLETNAAGELAPEALDNPLARVEEQRGEITLAHNRQVSEKFALQLSAGLEYSQISKIGTIASSREFVRPKGFIKGSYAYDETLDLRFEADRRVGQLSFGDFIGAVDIQNGADQTGNADLVPVQFWNYALEAEKDFGLGTTARLRLFYEDIEDLVDRIPVGSDGDGIGNIETAYASGAILNSTISGERWGFDGTELELFYMIQFHGVEDPVTRLDRRISGRDNSEIEVNFRHDIPQTDWAYGLGGEFNRGVPQYRLEEISDFRFSRPFSYLFLEHKDIAGLTLRGQLSNLFNAPETFTRTVFTDRRDRGAIDRIEERRRTFETFARVRLSGAF